MLTPPTADPAPARPCRVGRVLIEFAGPTARPLERGSEPDSASPACRLLIPVDGQVVFMQRERRGSVALGRYVLLDAQGVHELRGSPDAACWAVTIPRADIAGRVPSIDDHLGCRFSPNQQMASLLLEFVSTIAGIFRDKPPPNPEAFATEIVSFVALVIQAEDRGEAVSARHSRYRLKKRIFDFIDSRLADPELCPRMIAEGNRISLSYLYSLFSDNQTTVGQFIQGRRLQRAYEMLVADPSGVLTVSEIAYGVGFKNASHFSRSFSRRFRCAPREVRQLGATGHSLLVA